MSIDARLMELEFLSKLVRSDSIEVRIDSNIAMRDLIRYLIVEAFVSDLDNTHSINNDIILMAEDMLKNEHFLRCHTLSKFLTGMNVKLQVNHKGRIRLAELEHAIKSGREREPFGILYGARYWERDLRIALLSASTNNPVVLCFLDMNGLKSINDSRGHEVGNVAIRTFLQVVAANVEGIGDAYRYGGDEVVVVFQGISADIAEKHMEALLRQLGEETISGIERLTASCGIGIASNPNVDPKKFKEKVDAAQYKAKRASKESPGRRSALAVEDREARVL